MLSERCNLTPVANLLVMTDPKTVLDVGVGFGNYGIIARAYLDVWRGRMFKEKWQTIIDGIEYYKEFKTPIYDFIYDHLFWGDVFELLPKLPKYQAVILMHIVEHLEKPQALKLITMAKSHCTKRIIIGTPSQFFNTGCPDHPKEQHRCLFTPLEFKNSGYQVITLPPHEILAWKDL